MLTQANGLPLQQPPQQETLTLLRSLIAAAEAGDIVGVAVVVCLKGGDSGAHMAGMRSISQLGSLHYMAAHMVQDMQGRR
jgi:hypothetical protein